MFSAPDGQKSRSSSKASSAMKASNPAVRQTATREKWLAWRIVGLRSFAMLPSCSAFRKAEIGETTWTNPQVLLAAMSPCVERSSQLAQIGVALGRSEAYIGCAQKEIFHNPHPGSRENAEQRQQPSRINRVRWIISKRMSASR